MNYVTTSSYSRRSPVEGMHLSMYSNIKQAIFEETHRVPRPILASLSSKGTVPHQITVRFIHLMTGMAPQRLLPNNNVLPLFVAPGWGTPMYVPPEAKPSRWKKSYGETSAEAYQRGDISKMT